MTPSLAPIETSAVGDTQVDWYNLLDLGLEGIAFADEPREHPYDRLPAGAKGVVTDKVWGLSRQSAGLCGRFVSDATDVFARWGFRSPAPAAAHIPRTGSHGLDLYAHDGQRYPRAGLGLPGSLEHAQYALVTGMQSAPRSFLLYLPYRSVVDWLHIGVTAGHTMERAEPDATLPLCFYGTSLVHGVAASRPGMTYVAQVARRLGMPFFNFGFGGNGPMHLEMARLLAPLEVSAFVVAGCENMGPELVAERARPFAEILREQQPDTPIVFIGNVRYPHSWLVRERQAHEQQKNDLLAQAVAELQEAGDANVHLICGPLVGDDDDAVVDGVHPSDHGFVRMADQIVPVLQRILKPES